MIVSINPKLIHLSDGNSDLIVVRKVVEALAIESAQSVIRFSLKSGECISFFCEITDELKSKLAEWMNQ